MIHHKQVLVLNISCSLIGHTDNAGSWFEPVYNTSKKEAVVHLPSLNLVSLVRQRVINSHCTHQQISYHFMKMLLFYENSFHNAIIILSSCYHHLGVDINKLSLNGILKDKNG